MKPPVIVSVLATVTLALAGCGSSVDAPRADQQAPAAASSSGPASAASPAPSSAAARPSAPGSYVGQADYEANPSEYAGTAIVYFFHATWCPDCKATDASLTSDGVPAGLTVVKVDYDTATQLRKTYGITQQHTFVQVGADGTQLAKWTGTRTGEAIQARTV